MSKKTPVIVLWFALLTGFAFGGEPEPEHGTTRNTVSTRNRVAVGTYARTLNPKWTYLEVDTLLLPADVARGVKMTWSDVYAREKNTRWIPDKKASGDTRQLWKGVPPGSAAGRRVYVDVGGGFSIPGGIAGPGPSVPGKRVPDWYSLAVDIDMDVDSNRDGEIESDNYSEAGVAEDISEDDAKTNRLGALAVVGAPMPLYLRKLMERPTAKGAKPLSELVEGKVKIAAVKPAEPKSAGAVDLFYQKGKKALDAKGYLISSLWKQLVAGNDLALDMVGTKPGPLVLEATLEIRPKGGKGQYTVFKDKIRITVLKIEVSPQDKDFARGKAGRVLISAKLRVGYHTRYQTRDRKVTVRVTVTPPVANIPIYFRTVDPDDPSTYEKKGGKPDTDPDDNKDPAPKGNLTAPLSEVPGTRLEEGGRVIGLAARTVVIGKQAVAVAFLTITDRHAGDNYRVKVMPLRMPADGKGPELATTLLTAWKRVYVERDKMYRKGAFLSRDFSPDPDNKPDTIFLKDTTLIKVRDTVVVFDTANPKGETARVTAKTRKSITLNVDLKNKYDAGLGKKDRSAAVGVPAAGYYVVPMNKLAGAYDDAYVEWMERERGAGPVPLEETQNRRSQRTRLSSKWFKNWGVSNYIHLIGASKGQERGDDVYGVSLRSKDYSYVYWKTWAQPQTRPAVAAATAVHELGHQFRLAPEKLGQPNAHIDLTNVNWPDHLGAGICIMCYDNPEQDNTPEFCARECLWRIRRLVDDLAADNKK